MMQFISQFAFDSAEVQSRLEDYERMVPRFVRGLADFCTTFKLKISRKSDGGFALLTEAGLPAGVLSFERDYSRGSKKSDDGWAFVYSSALISKQRATGRAGRGARDSSKVTGIINAIKKNGEEPTDAKLLPYYKGSMRFAYHALGNAAKDKPTISLDSGPALALIKMLIENDKVSVETYRKDVETAYAGYLDRLAKFEEAKQSLKRFDNSTAVGVVPDGNNWFYIIADASYSPSADVQLTNWKRYNTLYNSPLAADAAMIRAYMEGRLKMGENELKLPFEDRFYPDIDVSVGYSSVQHGLWVLIPKNDVPALA